MPCDGWRRWSDSLRLLLATTYCWLMLEVTAYVLIALGRVPARRRVADGAALGWAKRPPQASHCQHEVSRRNAIKTYCRNLTSYYNTGSCCYVDAGKRQLTT